jgi:hypothetical protein
LARLLGAWLGAFWWLVWVCVFYFLISKPSIKLEIKEFLVASNELN